MARDIRPRQPGRPPVGRRKKSGIASAAKSLQSAGDHGLALLRRLLAGRRWLAATLSACLGALTLASFLFYRGNHLAQVERIHDYSWPLLHQVEVALQAKLENYETISLQFISNRDLNDMLARYVGERDLYDISRYNQVFSNFLEGYAIGDPGLYDAIFLDELHSGHKSLTMGESIPTNFIKALRGTDLYRQVVAADGKAVWLPLVHPNETNRYFLILGRRIKQLFTGKPLGVLFLLLEETDLDAFINAAQYNDDAFSLKRLAGDYFLIVDGRGTVVSIPLKDRIGGHVAGVIGRQGLRRLLRSETGGRFTRGSGERELLVTYKAVGRTGLHLLNVVSTSAAARHRFPRVDGYQPLILLLTGGLFAASLLLLWRRPTAATAGRDGKGTGGAPPPPVGLGELSTREKEVLSLLAQGLDNREIAGRLFMAEQTVKNYVSEIYAKLGVRDRVQASLKAIEAGLHRP